MSEVKTKRKKTPGLLDSKIVGRLIEDPAGMAKEYLGEDKIPSSRFRTPKHRLLCFMAAFGAPQKEISSATRFSISHVQGLLTRGDIKKEIIRIQDKVIGGEARKAFKMIFPEAFKTARAVMLDKKTKPGVRAAQARDFMDRHAGKPLQRVENETTVISELIMRLDESGKSKVEDTPSEGDNEIIDVTPTEAETSSNSEIDVDLWIDENLGD